MPAPPRPGIRKHDPETLERRTSLRRQRQNSRLSRVLPTRHYIPDGPPRRRHQFRCDHHRRSSPLRGLRNLRPTALVPLHHRVQVQRYQLRAAPGCCIPAGSLGIYPALPAGVREEGHYPKRIRVRLSNYQRYFRSGWAIRDHGVSQGLRGGLRGLLQDGTFPERKALVRNFVESIEVTKNEATLTYALPMPKGGISQESASVLGFVHHGPPFCAVLRTPPLSAGSAASPSPTGHLFLYRVAPGDARHMRLFCDGRYDNRYRQGAA